MAADSTLAQRGSPFDRALLLAPGSENKAHDSIGLNIAHNRALALRLAEEEDKKKEDKTKESANDDLKVYGNREREFVMEETPGSIFKLTMDNTHPLAFGYDKTYYGLILEASNYAFLKDGWNVGHAGKSAWITGFAGKNARKKLENSLLYGVQDLGRGKVIYMVNNPLFRGFWYNGKLLFGNAVFMVN